MNTYLMWYLIGLPVAWWIQKYLDIENGKLKIQNFVKETWGYALGAIILISLSWVTFIFFIIFWIMQIIKVNTKIPPKWL